jgi:hypothetical protein
MLAWFVQDEHYNIKRVQMNTRKKDEILHSILKDRFKESVNFCFMKTNVQRIYANILS